MSSPEIRSRTPLFDRRRQPNRPFPPAVRAWTFIISSYQDTLIFYLIQLVSFGKAIGGGQVDGIGAGALDIFTYDFYKQVEQEHGPFQGICGYASFSVMVSVRPNAAAGAPASQATSHLVSGNFFSVLGAEPIMGRPITPGDADAPGRNPVESYGCRKVRS